MIPRHHRFPVVILRRLGNLNTKLPQGLRAHRGPFPLMRPTDVIHGNRREVLKGGLVVREDRVRSPRGVSDPRRGDATGRTLGQERPLAVVAIPLIHRLRYPVFSDCHRVVYQLYGHCTHTAGAGGGHLIFSLEGSRSDPSGYFLHLEYIPFTRSCQELFSTFFLSSSMSQRRYLDTFMLRRAAHIWR